MSTRSAAVRTGPAGPDVSCRLNWYPPGYAQAAHTHCQAQISLLIAGELRESARGGERDCDRLSVARKPGGARHSVVFGPHGALILSWNMQDETLAPLGPSRRAHWHWQSSRRLKPLLGAVAGTLSAGAEPITAAEDLLWNLLALIGEDDGAPPPAARPLVSRLKEQIRLAPAAFSVEDAARDAGVHRIHLARLFRRHVGSTITAYRCRALAGAALRHILDPAKSLAEAALETGFADQSHMTRVLRAETGLTPGALRRTLLGSRVPR